MVVATGRRKEMRQNHIQTTRTLIKDSQSLIHPNIITSSLRLFWNIVLGSILSLARHCRDTVKRSFGIALDRVPVKPHVLGRVRRRIPGLGDCVNCTKKGH